MNSSDITNTIIIIIIFATINIVSVLGIGIQHIKQNWSEYKCMPVIIPFAGYFDHDPMDTFNGCIQGILGNFMSEILGPIYTIFQQLSAIGQQLGQFMSMFNNIAGVFKFNFLDMIKNAYSIGTKILLGLTQFAISLQDMVNKVLGIFVAIIFIFLGVNITVVSIWNGLPGQLVKGVQSTVGGG